MREKKDDAKLTKKVPVNEIKAVYKQKLNNNVS